MDQKQNIPLPQQEEGVEKNIESVIQATTLNEAKQLYKDARTRLLHVNNWHELCGPLSAVFQLTDDNGQPINDEAQMNHYFKIDIPGPGSTSGKGYDWVRVEEVKESQDEAKDCEFILIRVRPTDNPTTDDDNVAHFFSDKATSNFVVKRDGNVITAAVYGRNEKPNTETSNIIDKTRNAVIGATAVAGLSDPQWKSLANGVLGIK
jgi:hypothetical protein